MRGPDGGVTDVCRVVAAAQDLSAELTALGVIEGTCLDIPLNASSSPSKAAGGPAEGFQGSGDGGNGCGSAEKKPQPQPQHRRDDAAVNRKEPEKVVEGKHQRGEVLSEHDCASASVPSASGSGSSTSSSSISGQGILTARPLPAKPPVRGFHLVDLHAVVRNSVEWRQCLPKVG